MLATFVKCTLPMNTQEHLYNAIMILDEAEEVVKKLG